MATKENMETTPKIKSIVLIVFCITVWELIWEAISHYAKLVMNFSPEAFINAFGSTAQKMEMMGIFSEEFYLPHAYILIITIFLIPLFMGFYIGRHSEKHKYRNVAIIVALAFFFEQIMDFLHNPYDWKGFIFIMLLTGYLKLPFLLAITSIGAWIGSYLYSQNERGLHLLIYRDICERRKRSSVYFGIFFLVFVLKIESIGKRVEDFILPPLHYAYAPVKFNNHPKDRPLMQVGKDRGTGHWYDSIKLNKGNNFALLIYYNNNSHFYKAINTKLALDLSDRNLLTATLWAENAQPVQHSITLVHNCNNFPLLTYSKSAWYPNQHKYNWSMPLPFNQTGHEILNPTGLNIGSVDGMWVGQGYLIVTFDFACRD